MPPTTHNLFLGEGMEGSLLDVAALFGTAAFLGYVFLDEVGDAVLRALEQRFERQLRDKGEK